MVLIHTFLIRAPLESKGFKSTRLSGSLKDVYIV